MRIGCLQFAPHLGDVENNLTRAEAVLSKAAPADVDNLDLLVLPEMAFSGYSFRSLQHIAPHLEPSAAGISSLWARTMALKHNCTVAVGYPEKAGVSSQQPASPEYYNSLLLVNGDGQTVANYRKSFLFSTDEAWAQEGEGFYVDEVEGLGQVAMGISMDINPYKFQAPWEAFEFAFHVLEVEVNLVIVSMAWPTDENGSTFSQIREEPDMEALTYWVQRLEPIIRAESEEEIIVVFCNRCGSEDNVVYSGTSAVLGIRDGEVSVYGLLGRGTKELLVVDTSRRPIAKLLNQPDTIETEQPVAPAESPVYEAPATVRDQQSQWSSRESMCLSPATDSRGLFFEEVSREGRSSREEERREGKRRNGAADTFAPPFAFDAHSALPIDPSPLPAGTRPILAVETGPRMSPAQEDQESPRGTPAGNHTLNHGLYSPPADDYFDKLSPSYARPYEVAAPVGLYTPPMDSLFDRVSPSRSRHHEAPIPASLASPEESAWPYTHGIPSPANPRSPLAPNALHRTSSRAQEPKRSEPKAREARRPRINTAESGRTRSPIRSKTVEPMSAIEFRRANTSPFETTFKSAFDPVRSAQDDLAALPRKKSHRPKPIAVDDSTAAENWYREKIIDLVPLIASPSVFQTSFSRNVLAQEEQQYGGLDEIASMDVATGRTSRLEHYQGRSRSSSRSKPGHQQHDLAPSTYQLPKTTFESASVRAATTAADRSLPDMQALSIDEVVGVRRESSQHLSRSKQPVSRSSSRKCPVSYSSSSHQQTGRRRSRSTSMSHKSREPASPLDLRSPVSV